MLNKIKTYSISEGQVMCEISSLQVISALLLCSTKLKPTFLGYEKKICVSANVTLCHNIQNISYLEQGVSISFQEDAVTPLTSSVLHLVY